MIDAATDRDLLELLLRAILAGTRYDELYAIAREVDKHLKASPIQI